MFRNNATSPATASGDEVVGVMFDGRLVSRGDIGNAATTSRMPEGEEDWLTQIR